MDLFSDDLNTLSNDELFRAIESLAAAQPNEGWRLDYTEKWDDSALKNIAAFAHSFGGLLVVGVRKAKSDVVPELVGVDSTFEYKTKIASAIAANISPIPSYSIFECHEPAIPNKRFCVVRVRASKALHLITKKDLHPLYVRNEDESRPANAEQLRMLVDREREAPSGTQNFDRRAMELQVSKVVRFGFTDQNSDTWHLSTAKVSDAFLKLEMIPIEAARLELARSHEAAFQRLVLGLYTRVTETLQTGAAIQAEVRSGHSYEYLWYHKNLDHEGRWRILSTGEIGHSTQVKIGLANASEWSVVDVARHLDLFISLCTKWWGNIGYFGAGYLYAQLCVPGLKLLRHPDGYFIGSFNYVGYRPGFAVPNPSIRKDAILYSPSPGTGAEAVASVDYYKAHNEVPRLITLLLNQLVRPLGYAVVWDLFEESVRSFLPSARA